jgi:hypothetical protein
LSTQVVRGVEVDVIPDLVEGLADAQSGDRSGSRSGHVAARGWFGLSVEL